MAERKGGDMRTDGLTIKVKVEIINHDEVEQKLQHIINLVEEANSSIKELASTKIEISKVSKVDI